METIPICIIAGLAAGFGTGFAGLSASMVIAAILMTFTDLNSYEAIGIALASDVLASAYSAYTYGKNKNIDLENSKLLFSAVLCFTFVGAFAANMFPGSSMGNSSIYMTFILGLRYLFSPKDEKPAELKQYHGFWKLAVPIVSGSFIGFLCGFAGIGGGITILIFLTTVLGYELKTAVGTSVFMMTFTAFFGASTHFYLQGTFPDPLILCTCVTTTFVFAGVGSHYANKTPPEKMNRVTGTVLASLGTVLIMADKFFS